MKITNKIAVDSVESLNKLTDLPLPVRTAFKITKIVRSLSEILDTYNKVLSKLQQEHVAKDESGNSKSVEDPNNPSIKRLIFSDPTAFSAAYQELLEIETEIDIQKIKIEELGSIEVTPATLFAVEWLLED